MPLLVQLCEGATGGWEESSGFPQRANGAAVRKGQLAKSCLLGTSVEVAASTWAGLEEICDPEVLGSAKGRLARRCLRQGEPQESPQKGSSVSTPSHSACHFFTPGLSSVTPVATQGITVKWAR